MNHARTRQAIAVLTIAFLLLALITFNARSAALGWLNVTFLNVGQGDSALLSDANDFTVLIDGGEPYAGEYVVAVLHELGIDDIDILVASHSDADHIGGLINVLQATDIPIQAVVLNGYPGTSTTWNTFINAVAARGLTPTVAQFPAEYQWGEMSVHVLNPPAGLSNPASNDASLVLRVDHGDINFLFTGDIPSAVESSVIARGTPIAAEVLKVAHHGSAYSSSTSFLNAVGPRDSLISVGENSYGHPAPDTLQRLAAAHSTVWRTDRNGIVSVSSNGLTYNVQAQFLRQNLYLPMILDMGFTTPPPTATPTTATPTQVTETPTTPTTPPPPSNTGSITVTSIFYDGSGTTEPDEYVVIQNVDNHAIDVQNWTLRDNASHVYAFPAFTMQPNQVCRVYTNQSHPESCGFNYSSGSAIWNNSGDCAYLRNAQGQEVSSMCY